MVAFVDSKFVAGGDLLEGAALLSLKRTHNTFVYLELTWLRGWSDPLRKTICRLQTGGAIHPLQHVHSGCHGLFRSFPLPCEFIGRVACHVHFHSLPP